MIEVPVSTPQRAIIVQMEVTSLQKDQSAINAFAEFKDLSRSSGVEILDEISGKQDAPLASHFLKKGKIEEIKRLSLLNKDKAITNYDEKQILENL